MQQHEQISKSLCPAKEAKEKAYIMLGSDMCQFIAHWSKQKCLHLCTTSQGMYNYPIGGGLKNLKNNSIYYRLWYRSNLHIIEIIALCFDIFWQDFNLSFD